MKVGIVQQANTSDIQQNIAKSFVVSDGMGSAKLNCSVFSA